MRNNKINKIIIKVGSTSLCDDNGNIDKKKILSLVSQISKLYDLGKQVVLVSSGAVASGMGVLHLDKKPNTMPQKQALAAIGQARLMEIYEELFSLYNINVAQVLLNHGDFDDRKRLMNLHNSLNALLEYHVLPIVNENDTLAVDEIKVGDNDTLAALLTPVIDADLLILVSDIDGLYDSNPKVNKDAKFINYVDAVDEHILSLASDSSSNLGTGGMITKLKAAKNVNDYGSSMLIINGNVENCILKALDGEIGTWFEGNGNMNARKHWLTYRSKVKGTIIVDEGAKKALLNHKSLLPGGIKEVEGNFLMGQVIEVVDINKNIISKGIVNYSSDEIKLIKGHQSKDIEKILHYKDYDEVLHVNNMVLIK